MLATDPATLPNFEALCRQTGNRLVEASETDGVFRLLIEKTSS